MSRLSERADVVEFIGRGSRASAAAGCVLGLSFCLVSVPNLLRGAAEPVVWGLFLLLAILGGLLVIGGAIGSVTRKELFLLRLEPEGLRWGKPGKLGELVLYREIERVCCYWQDVTAASAQFYSRSGRTMRMRVRGLSPAILASVTQEFKRRFACPVEEW